MSGNQKQAPSVGAQTQARYQPAAYPFLPPQYECANEKMHGQQHREDAAAAQRMPTKAHIRTRGADIHAYVQPPPQQPSQNTNQGPPLRSMAPTGPPTQASTPPNADLKVQQHVQQQQPTMNIYPGRSQYNFQRPAQNNPATRMVTAQRQNQPPLYGGHPAPMVPYPMMNLQPMAQYPTQFPNQRPAFMPAGVQFSYPTAVTYQAPYSLQQQPPQYFYPGPRQSPSQVASVAQGMTHAPQQTAAMPPAPIPAAIPKKVPKKRSNAIQIINPETMRPIDDEESHPTSGESSARQTPQPQPPLPQPNVKEAVQALFAKQVAQSISNDNTLSVEQEPIDTTHHHPNIPESCDAPMSHQTIPFQITSNVHSRNDVVKQSSKLQPTNEFVPANNPINTAKETPVVSANSNSVEVTIPGKPKDRESPAKGRKSKEVTASAPKENAVHKDTAKEAVLAAKEVPTPAAPTHDVKPKEDRPENIVPAVQAPIPEPLSKPMIKEQVQHAPVAEHQPQLPAATQPPQPQRDDKKQQQQPQPKKADSSIVPTEMANVSSLQPAVSQDTSGKSKPLQRGKEQQAKQQTGGQQAQPLGQNSKPPAATVQQSNQSAKSNKANKMKELNLKGANKEGTDMDAFNMNVDPINANVAHNASGKAPQAPQQQAPREPVAHQAPAPPAAQPNPVVVPVASEVAPKKLEEPPPPPAVSIANSKPGPKMSANKVDVTAIVKDTPKPFVPPPPVVDNKDETDRAVSSNDKLVQAKNEVNAKTAISEQSEGKKTLQYKENQWSPQNQEGKKVYDRDFLMAVRGFVNSTTKPENIPLEVLASDDRSRSAEISRGSAISGNRTDFAPSFGGNMFCGKSQSTRSAPKRNSQQGKSSGNTKGGKSDSRIRVSISFKGDVKLHEAENAWKPARLNPNKEKLTEDDKKTDDLYKKVRGVLNKLTPQKFSTLLNQIKTLPVDTSERLQGVIDLVFEKAVDEPNFSVAYALMCRELALMQVPMGPDSKDFVNFRKLLVTRCQVEFEKNSSEEGNRNQRIKEIEECTDPEKKKELMLMLDEDDRRIRMKSVGNIRFIGELFKQQMLTVNIMLRCLHNLIENEDEDRLECLCKLLTTIGKELEAKNVDTSKIFTSMKNIVERKNGKISSRVRFMLQDVIDLRCSGWVPRRTDLNPKTIDQIQKEADNEQYTMQAMNSGPMTPRKDERNSGSNSERKRGGRNVSEDGWTTTSRGKPNTFSVQSDKLKFTQPTTDEPLGSRSLFTWGRGSGVKPAATAAAVNMYAPLEKHDVDNRMNSSSSRFYRDPYNSKGSSMDRSFKPFDGRNSRSGSQHRAPDTSQRNTPTPTPQPKPQAAPEVYETLTPEQLERKVGNIVDEFINDCTNFNETDMEIRTTMPPATHVQLTTDIIMARIDRSKKARTRMGALFCELVKKETISLDSFCAVLEKIFSYAEDLIVDVPQIWDFYAEFLVTSITSDVLTLSRLHKCVECLVRQDYARHFLAALFKRLIQEKDPIYLKSIWNSSGLSFDRFMDSKLVDAFISQHKFDFLVGTDGSARQGQSALTYSQIYEKLKYFIESKTSNDDVFKWITANVGERDKDPEFIRVLTTAYIESSMVNDKLNENSFRGCYNVFHRYIGCNVESELQCLYAIQSIVNKLDHPQGLLLKIFNALYEDAIISHESFIKWERSEDPLAQENKGVAVKQLTSFFTQLKETESESGSSSEE